MSDPEDIFSDLSHCCPGCGVALPTLPIAARFCPSCGHALTSRLAEELIGDGEENEKVALSRLATAWRRICRSPGSVGEAESSEKSEIEPRTPILRGYARALFRLGWHYENARGAQRNNTEALRCYDKAARLGNTSARSRLEKPGKSATSTTPPPT